MPDDAPQDAPDNEIHLPALLGQELNVSRSQARRLIGQGAVKVNGHPLLLLDVDRRHIEGKTIEVGRQKRSFVVPREGDPMNKKGEK